MSRIYSKSSLGLPSNSSTVDYDPNSGLPTLGKEVSYASGSAGMSFVELLTKPASQNLWRRVFVYDVGIGGSFWMSNGSEWRPVGPVVLATIATTVSKTDLDTNWYDLFAYTVPGGLLGSAGSIKVEPDFSIPSSVTNKNMRVMFGTATAFSKTRTNTTLETPTIVITNKSRTSQIYPLSSQGVRGLGGSGTIPVSSIDTTVDQIITVSGSWGTAGTGTNSITLAKCVITLEY